MGLIQFLVLCLIVGLVDWAIITYTPIPSAIKNLVVVVSVIGLVLLLLRAMGIFGIDVPIAPLR